MKSKNKTAQLTFFLLLFILVIPQNENRTIEAKEQLPTILDNTNYTAHSPILIDSNDDFISYDFPGSGTENDPYRIEYLSIMTSVVDDAINISDTTKFFVIQNCYLFAPYDGVFLERVARGTATIQDNTFEYGDFGITLWDSEEVRIYNNTFQYHDYTGIWLWESSYSIILDNEFTFNTIYIREESEFLYTSHTIETNLVNGKKLGYLKNLEDQTIDEAEYGSFIIVSCENLVIENQQLTNVDSAIRTYYCNNLIMRENLIENCEGSITITATPNTVIENNTIKNNVAGIGVWRDSNNCKIRYNTLKENEGEGVELWGLTSNNVVHHNWFIDNNPTGESQGFDVGVGNVWYDEESKEGNHWSDYVGFGEYEIGTHSWIEPKPVDKYPLDKNLDPVYFSVIFVLLPLLLVACIYQLKHKGKKITRK